MIGVISADIINSQKIPKQQYDAMLYQLAQSLRAISDKTTRWSMYRGNAFQLQITNSAQLVKTAIVSASVTLLVGLSVNYLTNRSS